MNQFKFNNKDTKTTPLIKGKYQLRLWPFQRLFHPNVSWKRFVFRKTFIKLPRENKDKFMDHYLFNWKFAVSKTGLKVLCLVALICTIYCITDTICNVKNQEIEVERFLVSVNLCLFLNCVTQTTKIILAKNHYQIRNTRFPKQKTNFLPTP